MQWPSGFEPEKSSVYARNEIAIAAPAERVWRWLIRAARWPDWYSNSRNVKFLRGPEPDLAAATESNGRPLARQIRSRVIVFEPPHELGWDARGMLRAFQDG